ncbi:MAG: hypothetical protein IPH07_10480 [Deltaproteobacteria bacterium]|nr:hypothetical protein [Deltaproteobacteria bacterium]
MSLTDDPSAIGNVCDVDADCPDGYACFEAGGIVAMSNCHILCTMDCECPDGYTCQMQNIKGNMFSECLQP